MRGDLDQLYRDLRPYAFAIAYRMLGSVSEAEDVVQDAFVRIAQAGDDHISSHKAFVATVTTRLAIDELRSARARRENYIGPWLPEPLLEDGTQDVAAAAETADSLTMAFLVVLETLTPPERAAFLLHDVFGYDYGEIGTIVGKTEASCRQLASRARRRVHDEPRFEASREERDRLAGQFFAACQGRDMSGLIGLLADDAVLYGDGGAKGAGINRPIHGRANIVTMLGTWFRQGERLGVQTELVKINGQPGAKFLDPQGRLINVISLDIADGAVQTIRSIINPDKLSHLGPLSPIGRRSNTAGWGDLRSGGTWVPVADPACQDERVRDGRELDLVLLGATGFVGRLTAGYLAEHAPPGLRIGLAGRSERRLAEVRAGLGTAAEAWPLLAADSTDRRGAQLLARKAGAIATTVGPYRRLGLPLAQACAEAGTDYADLTGEVLFIRDTIGSCHQAAVGTGARIVHSCGFDSVPSDLGVLLAHHAAGADGAGDLEDTTLVVTALRGGISGGTLASGLGQIDDVRASASSRRIVTDPYALSPDRAAEPALGDERELSWVRYDPGLGQWTGPFVMAGFNTRVVRRSNALLGWAYGRRFRYREVTGFGAGPAAPVRALAVTAAFTALLAGVTLPPSRALLRPVLPKPGEGPGEKARRTGFFRLEVHARTSSGARYLTKVGARGDPGYAATAVMLGESALCLALDRDRLPDRAGVLTPATAMGAALADRLRAAGQTFEARGITPP